MTKDDDVVQVYEAYLEVESHPYGFHQPLKSRRCVTESKRKSGKPVGASVTDEGCFVGVLRRYLDLMEAGAEVECTVPKCTGKRVETGVYSR